MIEPPIDERYERAAEVMAAIAERDEAVEYGTRMRREWQRECEDTNLMLQGLGLCPSEYRSEGGSLMLGRIQHALKKREASIVAERERDEIMAMAEKREGELRTRCEFLLGMLDVRESELVAARSRLAEAVALLRPLTDIPLEDFGKEKKPDYPLMGWNDRTIYVRDVLAARAFLAKMRAK